MPRRLTEEQAAEVRALYADGMTQQAIAGMYGVSRSVIGRHCAGVKDSKYKPRRPQILPRSPLETEAWQDFMARRHEIPKGPVTLNQALLGDPVPGRSALDRRRRA